MTISDSLKAKAEELKKIGRREVEDYRMTVANSMLDNPTKYFFYDLISFRLEELNKENVLAESASFELDMEDWSER